MDRDIDRRVKCQADLVATNRDDDVRIRVHGTDPRTRHNPQLRNNEPLAEEVSVGIDPAFAARDFGVTYTCAASSRPPIRACDAIWIGFLPCVWRCQ